MRLITFLVELKLEFQRALSRIQKGAALRSRERDTCWGGWECWSGLVALLLLLTLEEPAGVVGSSCGRRHVLVELTVEFAVGCVLV